MKTHVLIVGFCLLAIVPASEAAPTEINELLDAAQQAEDALLEQLFSTALGLLAGAHLLRSLANARKTPAAKDDAHNEWMQTFDGISAENNNTRTNSCMISDFVDSPDVVSMIKRIRKSHKQRCRRLKRKANKERRKEIRRHRARHCCCNRRCQIGWTCKTDRFTYTSDEDSGDESHDYSNVKTCLCLMCYQGDETRIRGGSWFGLYLAVVCIVALMTSQIEIALAEPAKTTANLFIPDTAIMRGSWNGRGSGGRVNGGRFNGPQSQPSNQRFGWVKLSKQAKLDLNIAFGDETDKELAEKLREDNAANEREKLLKLINARKLSAPGYKPITIVEGWDGPANETKSLITPNKTVAEQWSDAGHSHQSS